jgi:hypothetical protein
MTKKVEGWSHFVSLRRDSLSRVKQSSPFYLLAFSRSTFLMLKVAGLII